MAIMACVLCCVQHEPRLRKRLKLENGTIAVMSLAVQERGRWFAFQPERKRRGFLPELAGRGD